MFSFNRKKRHSPPPQNDFRQSLYVRLYCEELDNRVLPGSALAVVDADFSDMFNIAPRLNTNTSAIPPIVPAIMRTLARTEALPFTPAPEARSIPLTPAVSPRVDIAPVAFDLTLGQSPALPPLLPLGAFPGFNGGVFLREAPAPTTPPAAPTLDARTAIESPPTMTKSSESEPLPQSPAAAASNGAYIFAISARAGDGQAEDSGVMEFLVHVRAGTEEAAVDYTTTAGTATAFEDFTPVSSTLVIPRKRPGNELPTDYSLSIFVPVMPDKIPEANETFSVTLSNPVNAVFGGSTTATGTILNDDAVVPSITLAAETTYIPVNANRTNGSPWRRDAANNELIGLPTIRDFDLNHMRDLSAWNGMGAPPAGPAIVDPEIKKMTATVVGGAATGAIKVEVIYANAFTGGRVRLWSDQSKTTELAPGTFIPFGGVVGGSGNLPNYPTSDFYVEGTRPSRVVDDITIRVTYIQGDKIFTAEKKLTVTPVIDELSLVNPKTPPRATFHKDILGRIYGISSGEQADGDPRGAIKQGVTYAADVNVKGIGGDPMFLQIVTAVSQAQPTVVLTNGDQYNFSVGTATFPIIDSVAGLDPIPYYPTTHGFVYNADRKTIQGHDTPAFSDERFTGLLESMDATFNARMYLVWRYPDNTIYTLAWQDWQAGFQAITFPLPFVGLTLMPTSLVSASPKVITNVDPAKVVGPRFNDVATFVLV